MSTSRILKILPIAILLLALGFHKVSANYSPILEITFPIVKEICPQCTVQIVPLAEGHEGFTVYGHVYISESLDRYMWEHVAAHEACHGRFDFMPTKKMGRWLKRAQRLPKVYWEDNVEEQFCERFALNYRKYVE